MCLPYMDTLLLHMIDHADNMCIDVIQYIHNHMCEYMETI